VEEVTNMRKELRDNDVKMKVIKNTYLRRAAAKAGIEGLDDTFVGPTAVIYTDNADDVTEPARIVSKYEDDFDVIEIKGGMLEGIVSKYSDDFYVIEIKGCMLEGKLTSKDEIKELAAIPGREGLLSMLVSVLQAPVRDFAYAVKAVAESKDEDSAE